MFVRLVLCGALAAAVASPLRAQTFAEGYLCCNLRSDGSWISDINYADGGKRLIAAGTPARATAYGRYRVYLLVDGMKQTLGNDYSRDLNLDVFSQRYVVKEDPKAKMAGYPEKIREAIRNAQLVKGMTREQVVMSVGYPVSSENPNLDAKVWRFWLNSFAEFQVTFDGNNRVSEITTFDPATRHAVVME